MNQKDKAQQIEKLEKQLNTLVTKIYDLNIGGKRITKLIHPRILVRVLPKETRLASGLFLPGNVQNKPLYEGVVIATWQPFYENRIIKGEDVKIYKKSECTPGDHILFPHWEGQPLKDILDDKYYRVVTEQQVIGKLDYKGHADKAAQIRKLSEQFYSITMSGARGKDAQNLDVPATASMFTS